MNIYILEDDLLQRTKLNNIVNTVIYNNRFDISSIIQTSKSKEIIEKIKANPESNLYLLDIQIKNNQKQGLELAKEIRTIDTDGVIVFITTHSEFASKTYEYKVSALDFIDKEWPIKKIEQHILDAITSLRTKSIISDNKDEMFIFNNQSSNFQVPFNEILYFETTDISHKLKLVCKNRVISFYATMKSIENLDDRFFQCHRSYIINLANVIQIDRHSNLIYFSKEIYCLVTRRKIKSTLSKLKNLNIH